MLPKQSLHCNKFDGSVQWLAWHWRLPPSQGVENVVPVPKQLDREERAKPE